MVWGCLLLASCTDGLPEPTERSEPESTSPPSAQQVWSLDLPIIGQPRAAGDLALAHVAQAQELALVGVDAATRAQLWSQPRLVEALANGDCSSMLGPSGGQTEPVSPEPASCSVREASTNASITASRSPSRTCSRLLALNPIR